MSNSAKLKKKAAELESKKHYEKALEVYEQVLTSTRGIDEERDVPLYNRVGDLHYRIGNNEQAIHYYEQAADLYAEGGFFNNAIALCNKILRYSPGRTIIYYKLGLISAKKGFNSDAKQNFLEYADRMQRQGKMDEAFRALKEFADLCPGQDDVRLMLAEQLARADRKDEALEQLELLYDMLESDGRSSEANAALDRIKALDPGFKPRRAKTPRTAKKEGLVFLDLDFDGPGPIGDAEASPAVEGLELTSLGDPNPRAHASPRAPAEEPHPHARRAEPVAPHAEPEIESAEPAAETAAEVAAEHDFAPPPIFVAEGEQLEADSREEPNANTGANELRFISTPVDVSPVIPELAPLDLAPLIDSPEPEPEPLAAERRDAPDADASPSSNASPEDANPLEGLDVISTREFSVEEIKSQTHHLTPDDDFIDLGEWLERNRTPVSTRMITHDEEPLNDEQKDFGEMLDKFKAGISKNVDDEDFGSHYDLGIAFREMGLLDEAIGSFQKAARGKDQHVRACEAIGECFMDKGEAGVTISVLQRLIVEPGMTDSRLVGVLYLLGRAAELLGRSEEAAGYFQRVLAVHIGFRDAADRLASLTQTSR